MPWICRASYSTGCVAFQNRKKFFLELPKSEVPLSLSHRAMSLTSHFFLASFPDLTSSHSWPSHSSGKFPIAHWLCSARVSTWPGQVAFAFFLQHKKWCSHAWKEEYNGPLGCLGEENIMQVSSEAGAFLCSPLPSSGNPCSHSLKILGHSGPQKHLHPLGLTISWWIKSPKTSKATTLKGWSSMWKVKGDRKGFWQTAEATYQLVGRALVAELQLLPSALVKQLETSSVLQTQCGHKLKVSAGIWLVKTKCHLSWMRFTSRQK